MKMKVKICGMRQADNVKEVSQLRPDFIGIILYPKSARYVPESMLSETLGFISNQVSTIAVFVNEKTEEVLRLCRKYNFLYAQLHGNESAEDCKILSEEGLSLIKAVSVSEAIDFDSLKAYEPFVDFFLFDTKSANYGGSGRQFDWNLLKRYPLKTPYFLSGGIGSEDIVAIIKSNPPGLIGIDANSRLEVEPGLKNVNKVSHLINQIRKA